MGPEGSKGNEVVHYRNGQPMYDEFEEDDGEEGVPMAKPTIAPVKSPQAQKRGAVELPCPGSNRPGRCPPEMVHSWKCAECHDLLEYGFDDHFYCKCGKAPAESFTFHCGQRKHGLQYLGFQPSVLSNLVDKLKAFKEINILILGETGVGKSTWINGFVNFVTYATLDEALQEPVYLIPAHFTTLDEKYEMQKVTMGKSDNEDETPGQSCTQMPKTYVFRKGNNIIRLIDTPGIGDTRGAEQDKKNFQFIMDHLSHYDSLHGICILLKPNNARLTVMFRFCIKELLSHLHRDACENIVFVFTNARSTFYRPGDTYQALQKLIESSKGVNYHVNITLGPNTVYCVDNEAVRFMAALKFGIKFGESEQENFKKSWETSVKETNRLVDYVANRSPHMLRQTLSLNEARRQILAFTEPLAHITKNIQTNIQAADDKADEILHLQHSRKDLEGRLYVPSIDLETIPLPYPRTVCVAQKCIKMVGQKANYITHCHEHCYLTGIEPGKYPQPGLQSCAAMGNKQTCSHCGCIWEMHMHIEYEINEVEVPMVDSSIQALLSQRDGNILAVQQTIQDLQDRKAQLNNEMDEITKVATKFGYFLKSNAMIPYNDSMEDYLQYLIRAEEEKVAIGASRKGLEDYQGMLQRYREEKKLLEQAMASGANHAQITATEIDSAIKSLYSLPINGQVIKNLVETKNWTSGQQMEHAETIYKPAPQYKKQKKQSNKKGLLERGVDYVANLWTGGDRNRNQYGKSDYGGNYANGNHGYRGYQQAYPPKGHNYNSQYGHSNRGAYGYGADRYAPQNTYRPGSHSQTDPYAGRGPSSAYRGQPPNPSMYQEPTRAMPALDSYNRRQNIDPLRSTPPGLPPNYPKPPGSRDDYHLGNNYNNGRASPAYGGNLQPSPVQLFNNTPNEFQRTTQSQVPSYQHHQKTPAHQAARDNRNSPLQAARPGPQVTNASTGPDYSGNRRVVPQKTTSPGSQYGSSLTPPEVKKGEQQQPSSANQKAQSMPSYQSSSASNLAPPGINQPNRDLSAGAAGAGTSTMPTPYNATTTKPHQGSAASTLNQKPVPMPSYQPKTSSAAVHNSPQFDRTGPNTQSSATSLNNDFQQGAQTFGSLPQQNLEKPTTANKMPLKPYIPKPTDSTSAGQEEGSHTVTNGMENMNITLKKYGK
ncbi:uncharacterized protein LOC129594881 [Paramacrobiotus metropolitanus]|uniref:uncharacterized protein LOC129594881 n=1 Tax=Paramacrobiotus metropolitanus TaxID=2943436 RepID=UPI0024456EBB|nr:uncharacterized protein LOC129594881 [Paramacrobiotus metropolitanus]